MCAYFNSFLKLTQLRLFPASRSKATHILIQSNYIPTCFGGDHHHLQRRQRNRPQHTAIRCLLCYAHIAVFRVRLQHWAVCHTSLVCSCVVGCTVDSGGSV